MNATIETTIKALPALAGEARRLAIISILQADDSNGCYSDEDCISEGIKPLNLETLEGYLFSMLLDE